MAESSIDLVLKEFPEELSGYYLKLKVVCSRNVNQVAIIQGIIFIYFY